MSRFLAVFPAFTRLGLLFASTLLGGCANTTPGEPVPLDQWLEVRIADKTIEVQIAQKATEMAKGLMFRTNLGENRGMLFFYAPPRQMSFWMRNTRIPLDIGYFTADGVLREVYPLYPMDERSVQSRRDDLLFALEMNQGWFAGNGIHVGDQFDLGSLRKALISRGIEKKAIPF